MQIAEKKGKLKTKEKRKKYTHLNTQFQRMAMER